MSHAENGRQSTGYSARQTDQGKGGCELALNILVIFVKVNTVMKSLGTIKTSNVHFMVFDRPAKSNNSNWVITATRQLHRFQHKVILKSYHCL